MSDRRVDSFGGEDNPAAGQRLGSREEEEFWDRYYKRRFIACGCTAVFILLAYAVFLFLGSPEYILPFLMNPIVMFLLAVVVMVGVLMLLLRRSAKAAREKGKPAPRYLLQGCVAQDTQGAKCHPLARR